jgi:hypothetical protein
MSEFNWDEFRNKVSKKFAEKIDEKIMNEINNDLNKINKRDLEIKWLIEDIRSTPGATLSREGCLDLFNYIEELYEALINEMQKTVNNQVGFDFFEEV